MARSQANAFTLTPEVRRTSTVVVLGSIMSILDTTIVAVALRRPWAAISTSR